jgi:putative drug exporter of the RND superfamily
VVVSLQPGGAPYRAVLASLAIGILMDAFLVRTLLVPSAVALLGRWNWWPSRLAVSEPQRAVPVVTGTPRG